MKMKEDPAYLNHHAYIVTTLRMQRYKTFPFLCRRSVSLLGIKE